MFATDSVASSEDFMAVVFTCPECGQSFRGASEEDVCPACLVPLESMTVHHSRLKSIPLITRDLTGEERAIDLMMRRNRGVVGL